MSLPASSSFATVAETIAGSSGGTAILTQALTTAIPVNTTTQVLTYCVRDNAGNTTKGVYPVITDACFSATNMSTIPNLDTYRALTKTRIENTTNTINQKYGYAFSENTTNANCFRGILASNVTTLIANQLTPRTTTTLSNWADLANVKNTTTPNTNGYYYYNYATLSASNSTLSITTSPTGSGTKTVVVDGGNIRITNNLTYANTNTT